MSDNTVTESTDPIDQRAVYINGLRALAQFLELHPELPCPSNGMLHPAFVATKEELARLARTPGVRWDKDVSDNYFALVVKFSAGHGYEVYTDRAKVCRKVLKGRRIEPAVPALPEREVNDYEWVCDEPLLASGGAL